MGLVHPTILTVLAVVDVMDIAREKEKIVISPVKSASVLLKNSRNHRCQHVLRFVFGNAEHSHAKRTLVSRESNSPLPWAMRFNAYVTSSFGLDALSSDAQTCNSNFRGPNQNQIPERDS
jgi:hypothetical protein